MVSLPKRQHVLLLLILSFVLWASPSRAQQPELAPDKRADIKKKDLEREARRDFRAKTKF